MVVQGYNPSTWKVESGGSGVQNHPLLWSELEASPGCMSPYLSISHTLCRCSFVGS